jgi:hypothetical protein
VACGFVQVRAQLALELALQDRVLRPTVEQQRELRFLDAATLAVMFWSTLVARISDTAALAASSTMIAAETDSAVRKLMGCCSRILLWGYRRMCSLSSGAHSLEAPDGRFSDENIGQVTARPARSRTRCIRRA